MYILGGRDGKTPVRVSDTLAWGRWMQLPDRILAQDVINGFMVSTVFLGLDHAFLGGPPVLFETMVFGPESFNDEIQVRYTTWDEALAGHQRIAASVREWEQSAAKITGDMIRRVAKPSKDMR